MFERNQRMRTKITAYHRHFVEARAERRQADLDALGEQIFANACNWLRAPGQRRPERHRSVYRVPTPHPCHRRRLGEPEADDEDWEEENDDDKDQDSSPPDSSPSERPPESIQLQRRGGQRHRSPLPGRRSSAVVSVGSEQAVLIDEPPPVYSEHDALQCQQDPPDCRDEPTPEEEIQAIVRNVQQRRQVVVIQPSFPFPTYSAGEIVEDLRQTVTTTISRAQNVRMINIVPRHQPPSSTRNIAAQTDPALHYPDQSHRNDQALNHTNSSDSLPLPPGVSRPTNWQDQEPPVYFLPSPALDLSSANLTGSLSNLDHEPGLSPGGLVSSTWESQNVSTHEDEPIITIEHIEDVSLESGPGDEEITVQHVEHAPQATYRNAGPG